MLRLAVSAHTHDQINGAQHYNEALQSMRWALKSKETFSHAFSKLRNPVEHNTILANLLFLVCSAIRSAA